MKAESNMMPQQPFVVDKRGKLADITFFDEVEQIQTEEGKAWQYQTYQMTIPYRDGLEPVIQEQYSLWLETAKASEVEVEKPKTIEERVESSEGKIATMEETINVIFGGI